MPCGIMKGIGKSFRTFFALSLAVALVGGISVPGLAQAGKSATSLSSLPPDAQGPISAALGKDDSRYWVHRNAKGFRGQNPRHALVAEFTRQGAEIRSDARSEVGSHNLRWRLETRGYGYGNALLPVSAAAPQAKANRVEYRRDSLTEWYENGPLGLEQGFTLAHPPGKPNGQALTVELALRGDLVLALDPGEKGLHLRRKDGEAALRYTGLKARDATGRELRSWLEVRGERLLVRVDDGGAHYPLVVDPWVQQAELTASDGAAGDYFGSSVAVDGSTAVVGAPGHNRKGAVYVFVESGGTWTQQAELTASDGAANDGFGWSAAVSHSTIVVGASGRTNYQGAAYVFVESGGTWTQQAELTASDGAAYDDFGNSVAVSGSTVVVGALGHTNYQGAAYVFVESGGTWSQQAELTASDGAAGENFGYSVAVSGSTAVVGALLHKVGSNWSQGAAYVFVASGGTWTQQAELTASDGAADDDFGNSVAVSGSTAVVGALYRTVGSNLFQGAAYVFVESGGTWSQQAELTTSDGAQGDQFGYSVAVSGSTAVVVAVNHQVGSNWGQGAAYVFVESGGTWSQQAELTASDGAANNSLGYSVAISGSTAVAGAPYHAVGSNANQGAAYMFGSGSPTVTLSPTKLSFGKQALDTTSKPKIVTVTNTGTATLDISSITASGEFAITANTCGSTLAVGKKCTVKVTFTPTQLGTRTGTLAFTDDAPNSPQTVPLTGIGTSLSLTPATWNFGSVTVGQTSSPKPFTLTNQTSSTVGSIVISLAGTAPSDFKITNTTCGSTLAGNSSCSITVVFNPQVKGMLTAQLKVSSNGVGSPQTGSLKGTGT